MGLAVLSSLLFVLSDSAAVMLSIQVGVCAASTLVLGAGWRRERRRGSDLDGLIGLAFVSFLLYTLAVAAFGLLPVALGVTLPLPSVVDATFFLAYFLFGLFLWRLGSRTRPDGHHQFLDTLVVTLGVMPAVWVRMVEPLLVADTVSAGELVLLAYPAFVLVLLGLSIRLAFRAHRMSAPYVLLGGWIGLELAGDLVQLETAVAGTYAYGQPWQALWVLSAGCVGAVALHPGARDLLQVRRGTPVQGRRRLYILGSAIAGPIITLAVADGTSERADLFCLLVGLGLIVAVCLRLSGLMVDVAEQRRGQQELRRLSETLSHQSLHDPLTGLANRALLNARLQDALAPGAPTSVLLLDVDDFKLVNDSLGHAVGDLLLIEVARRVQLELRAEDRGGRLGGDEFVVILDGADAEHAQALAERLLVSLATPMVLAGFEFSVSVSIGISTSDHVGEGLNLLGAADMAMYLAKQL